MNSWYWTNCSFSFTKLTFDGTTGSWETEQRVYTRRAKDRNGRNWTENPLFYIVLQRTFSNCISCIHHHWRGNGSKASEQWMLVNRGGGMQNCWNWTENTFLCGTVFAIPPHPSHIFMYILPFVKFTSNWLRRDFSKEQFYTEDWRDINGAALLCPVAHYTRGQSHPWNLLPKSSAQCCPAVVSQDSVRTQDGRAGHIFFSHFRTDPILQMQMQTLFYIQIQIEIWPRLGKARNEGGSIGPLHPNTHFVPLSKIWKSSHCSISKLEKLGKGYFLKRNKRQRPEFFL